jgi:hypothetical protein
MNIKTENWLYEQYDILKTTAELITQAAENHWWIALKTPGGESYLTNVQARVVLELAQSRIKEIEDLIK